MINVVWKPAQDLDFGEIEVELRSLLKEVGETFLQLILAEVKQKEVKKNCPVEAAVLKAQFAEL